ncbi:hypothetical protein, partial [Commensalibacter sp. W8163]
DNQNGSLVTNAHDAVIQAKGDIDNTNGQIGVKTDGNVQITGQKLTNKQGLIRTTNGDILLDVAGLDNGSASILTDNGTVNVHSRGDIDNTGGQIGIKTSGNLTLNAGGDIRNNQGQLVTSAGNIELSGNTLDNTNGQVGSLKNGNLTLVSKNDFINKNG